MEIDATKKVMVNAKILKLHMKVRDQFGAELFDQEGCSLKEYEGYVPSFMPEDHYGDYLILDIDIDTGHITNWKTPTKKDIEEFIKEEEK